MAAILYMTVSRDGFIAGPDGETPWSDASWESFNAFVLSCDKVLLGKNTYAIMRDNDELIAGPQYVVVTGDDTFDTEDLEKMSIRSAADMPAGERIGIIGGGELNGRLAELGVIDEIYLDIEPVELHAGIKLFGSREPQLKLEHIASRQLGDATVQRHFKAVRPHR